MWLCAAACAFVAWQFVAVALAVAGVVGEAGWAAAADAAVAECTARARDAAADTAFRASWAREGVKALGSSLRGLAVSNTAAAVGPRRRARGGGEVAEAASLILLELEVRSLPKLAPPPGHTPWPHTPGRPGRALQARGCAAHWDEPPSRPAPDGEGRAAAVSPGPGPGPGRHLHGLRHAGGGGRARQDRGEARHAAAWLAYVGFWREAAAAIGRQLLAAANAVVALLHLGGAVTAGRAAVASAAAAAATAAVATGGAAGSTAHGAPAARRRWPQRWLER